MKNFNWIVLVIGMLLYAIIILNAADAQDDLEFTAPRTSANSMAVTNNAAVGGQLAVEGILNASNSTASVDTVDATGSGRFVLGVTTPVILMPGSTLVIQSATQSTTFTVNNNGRIAVNGIVFASPSMYYDGANKIRTNGQISAQQMVSAGTKDHTNAATRLAASLNDTGVTPAGEARLFLLEARGNYGMSFLFDGQAASDLNIYYATPNNPRVAGQFYDYSSSRWVWTANNGAGVQEANFFVDGDDTNPAGTYAGTGNFISDDYDTHPSFIERDGKVWKERIRLATDVNTIIPAREIKELDEPVLFVFDTTEDNPRGKHTDEVDFIMQALPAQYKIYSPTGDLRGVRYSKAMKRLEVLKEQRLRALELQVAEILRGN